MRKSVSIAVLVVGAAALVGGAVSWVRHLMEAEHGAAVIAAMRRVKRALDPGGILNPSKGGL